MQGCYDWYDWTSKKGFLAVHVLPAPTEIPAPATTTIFFFFRKILSNESSLRCCSFRVTGPEWIVRRSIVSGAFLNRGRDSTATCSIFCFLRGGPDGIGSIPMSFFFFPFFFFFFFPFIFLIFIFHSFSFSFEKII